MENVAVTHSAEALENFKNDRLREIMCGRMRDMIASSKISHFIGVHDALSAVLAEKCGADALWISGFGLSTTLGYRDASEIPWSAVADFIERIASLVNIPLLVDIDTGFGNANNAHLVSATFSRRGAAGVCIEDKAFPKVNSFADKVAQELTPVNDFCRKVEACKRAFGRHGPVVVARTEALIVGASINEALSRCHSAVEAGADAILIHSKKSTSIEVVEFCSQWSGNAPVLVIPTTYASSPISDFAAAHVGGVIWANQPLRAGAAAISAMCRHIIECKGPVGASVEMISLENIFSLYRYDEL